MGVTRRELKPRLVCGFGPRCNPVPEPELLLLTFTQIHLHPLEWAPQNAPPRPTAPRLPAKAAAVEQKLFPLSLSIVVVVVVAHTRLDSFQDGGDGRSEGEGAHCGLFNFSLHSIRVPVYTRVVVVVAEAVADSDKRDIQPLLCPPPPLLSPSFLVCARCLSLSVFQDMKNNNGGNRASS